MNIMVIGAGCSACSLLYNNTVMAAQELGIDTEIVFEHDIAKGLAYEVLQLPALIINEKAASYGKELSVDEVKEILRKYV